MNLDIIAQIGLAIFSITSIILLDRDNKWGFVIGLIGQVFYFTTSIINEQWGLFITTIAYTLAFIYGIKRHFSRKKKRSKQ